MTAVKLFPPQVLSDLNFFNVSSEKELASRLRALQRVAAAAIGAYLMGRYQPLLGARLGSSWIARQVATVSFYVGYGCLSFPTFTLIVSGVVAYRHAMLVVSHIGNKEISETVVDVAAIGCSYFTSQIYRDSCFEISPNFLEKLFQIVEDKLTKPLWDRFYKKSE